MKHPCIGEVISSSFSPCGRRVLKHDGLLVESADARVRSPRPACGRLRGEVGALLAMQSIVRRASGEGDSPRVELAERAPHPNPLPAKSGEREKRLAAAAPPTQPNLIMPTPSPTPAPARTIAPARGALPRPTGWWSPRSRRQCAREIQFATGWAAADRGIQPPACQGNA